MKHLFIALLFALLPSAYAEEITPVIQIGWGGGGFSVNPAAAKSAGKNPGLLFAAWADGKIVWSRDPNKGGAPFLTARLDSAKINGLLERWSKVGELGDPQFPCFYSGPDSSFLKIALRLDGKTIEWASWHEGFESNPNLVALPGITSLDGRSREELLKGAPPEFLRFRGIWKDLRDSTAALIPDQGEPYAEEIPILKK